MTPKVEYLYCQALRNRNQRRQTRTAILQEVATALTACPVVVAKQYDQTHLDTGRLLRADLAMFRSDVSDTLTRLNGGVPLRLAADCED